MKILLTFLIVTLLGGRSSAIPFGGVSTDPWYAGRVQLASGDWLTGEVRYNPDLHLLEFGLDGTVQVFAPHRVTQFYFFDPESGHDRTFVTRIYDPRGWREMATFFEVLVEGRVQLLAHAQEQRSGLLRRLIGRGSNAYFLAYPDGQIVAYRGNLRQLYTALADHRAEVALFVERVNWYRHEEKPLTELVRFYNSLSAGGGQ